MKDSVVYIISLFLIGSLIVLAVTHPQGFSTAAGTIFGGFNSWGQTLSGQGNAGRYAKGKG